MQLDKMMAWGPWQYGFQKSSREGEQKKKKMVVTAEENQVKVVVFVHVFTRVRARAWLHTNEKVPWSQV